METLEEIIERGRKAAFERAPDACKRCGEGTISPATVCEKCAEGDRRRRLIAGSLSTIPETYRWSRFDAPELASRVKVVSMIMRARSMRAQSTLVFIGASGVGKTSLAVATLRDRLEHAPDEKAVFAPAWRLGIARARSEDSDPGLVRSASFCDLLVIDDLGSERNVPSNPVPDIIFERHAEGRATWVTTWMTHTDVAARYGDGIARRIYGRAVIIDCGAA